jgi:hypothetical protein
MLEPPPAAMPALALCEIAAGLAISIYQLR